MSKYNVYGIGNALVDQEYAVTPEFLEEMGIAKGLMTLVDEQRQTDLNQKMGIDPEKRCCGGSAANTVIAVSQLGGSAFYSCKVASDESGDFYAKDLESEGLASNLVDGRDSGMTGSCMVFVTPDADRTMNTYLGISEGFGTSEIREDEIKQSEYLYIEGYLVTSPTAKAAAIQARKVAQANGVKVALTFSDPFMVGTFKDGFLEMMGNEPIDLLFCNEEEALSFTGTETIEAAVEKITASTKAFAITLGPKGAVVGDGTTVTYLSTEKVDTVDTNGAGDLFAGTFLYAITHGQSFPEAGALACRAASKLVTQYGARLAKEDLLAIKNG